MENDERKKIVEIDLTAVQNAEELHSLLKKKLDFPSFYGMNWNAFWDAITGLVDLPERLVLVGWNDMANKLSEDAKIMKYYLDKYEEKYNKYIKCIFEYK